ncbi:MAG: tetratricopeptide repeat protein [Bacteroidetes bacterium]|nr:tetratricopeptide repeat protein [Bacteroidota bacterium]MBU1720729.1 tetratricopeptide repeat protein [Bacteroidota bacterium]
MNIASKNKVIVVALSAMILIPVLYLIYWAEFIHPPSETDQITVVSNDTNTVIQADPILQAEQVVKANPSANNYINLGLAYYQASRYHECINATRKALEYDPNSALAYNNICSAYNSLKMWDEAFIACNKAIALNPDYTLAKNNKKVAIDGKAGTDVQISEQKKLTGQSPTFENYINLGNLYYQTGLFAESVDCYKKASEIDPKNAIGYNNICSGLNALQKFSEAIPYCKKALEINPDFELAKNNLKYAEGQR